MINNYLERQIKENFSYQPTFEQEIAVKSLSEFLLSTANDTVFVLRGYAGTGKTSLVGALVKAMDKLQQKSVLLAPTGRAAKVFSAYAGHPAFTIHKKIYRQQSFSNEVSNFSINDNLTTHTLYIVDEASMISNEGLSGSMFGTGRLLDDLVEFVYSGAGCRLLLMGDTAQLPPVGEEQSPALATEALKGYGLNVIEVDLTQVVRQVQSSGILWNATQIRQLIAEDECFSLPKIKVSGFPDIQVVRGDELTDTLTGCYEKDGMDETIVVCRSNKRANIYNKGIRAQILYREDELNTGDLLMVAKNNYFWTEKYKEMDFIANGEIAVVRRVRRTRELYGFRFAEVLLAFPDQNDFELEANLLLDTLHSDAPALPKTENDRLFYSVLEDYVDITVKRERMKKMKADPHYNALQVKYAYAVTCHKAQGGQWQNVFLDQGYMSDEYLTPDYFRWLYTAFTRASKTLYLVNYPEEQIE
ncbi:AAA family ATPase [Bacteroides fragilis]|uniref:ATP-dependent DNA helicase n=1 Tax=Bacteroides fragilis TaxID=817 RepID=UPI0015F78480|nr:AAA family ATPase [Bacteroides fragilis]MBA5645632.1 AAA family ATPase [Bacteroides fragilis]MCE8849663.1 AAA family ATPase [Bacteroides fragilis]MCE8880384.1 AAA family ATPase [Bacteroides fragilis]